MNLGQSMASGVEPNGSGFSATFLIWCDSRKGGTSFFAVDVEFAVVRAWTSVEY